VAPLGCSTFREKRKVMTVRQCFGATAASEAGTQREKKFILLNTQSLVDAVISEL
jgi:hypothetical protein